VKKLRTWNAAVTAAALFYVLIVAGVAFFSHAHTRRTLMEAVDSRLLAGAASIPFVLADDFHDRAARGDPISTAEDEQNIRDLTALSRRTQLAYLYTLLQREGVVHITSSSASEEELENKSEVRYDEPYEEALHFTRDAFQSTQAVYVSYTDRWGVFRAAYLPMTSPGGVRYLAAADIEISHVEAMLQEQLVESLAMALVMLLASLPIFVLYVWKERRHARTLEAANASLHREMQERKNIERELIQAHKMEAIGTLAGGVAHDFNNILASIIGFTELARDGVTPGSALARDLDEISRAAARAKDLVRQILTFARRTSSDAKPTQVTAVAREVITFISASLAPSITIRSELEGSACVRADQVSIHQVFMNLCTNAVQAMARQGGELRVTVRDVVLGADGPEAVAGLPAGPYVRIVVTDNGPGIPPGILDSIFEPYFTTKLPTQGTGLGLAVVHGIVKSLGGSIAVQSTLGQGATFTLHLPSTPPAPVTQAVAPAENELPGGSEHILVVDDEPTIAKTSGRILERLGYRVSTCTSGAEALDLVRNGPDGFQLVITDLIMPNLPGDQLAAELAKLRPQLPIILCTGYVERLQQASLRELGISMLILKPFNRGDLARAVRTVLDQSVRPPAGAVPGRN